MTPGKQLMDFIDEQKLQAYGAWKKKAEAKINEFLENIGDEAGELPDLEMFEMTYEKLVRAGDKFREIKDGLGEDHAQWDDYVEIALLLVSPVCILGGFIEGLRRGNWILGAKETPNDIHGSR